MSGTDYTTTPNLGLYKPISNRAIGTWGDLWNSNADALDAALATGAGGAFLPLAGGTMLGPLNYTATGGTTSRAAQDRAHDWINVKDFGAKLDGTTNDTAAWAAARAAASDYGTITVPRGRQIVSAAPTGGPATPVLWKYDGNYIGSSGSSVVTSMGTDVVESFIGSKYFARGNSYAGAPSVLRLDNTINHTGGSAANTSIAFTINNTVSGAPLEHPWGLAITHNTSQQGGNNNVVFAAYGNRMPTATGAFTVFAANISSTDRTGLNSSASGPHIATEFDVTANGLDDGGLSGPYVPAGQGSRIILDVVGAQYNTGGADCEIGWGVRTEATSGSSHITFIRAFAHIGRFKHAAFSTEYATPDSAGANAIWLGDNHTIALNAAGTAQLQYRTATSRLYYTVNGVDQWSVDASGNVRARGTVTGSTTP